MPDVIIQRQARMDSAVGPAPAHDLAAHADEELLRQYREQRGAAVFNEIVRRHHPMVLRACQRLVGNVHELTSSIA